MVDVFSKFDPGEMIGLVAVLGCVLCGLTAIVMGIGFAICKQALLAGLKRSMLARGMSAEEIRMVIDAGSYEPVAHAKQPAYREV
jgi:hypothetical protein